MAITVGEDRPALNDFGKKCAVPGKQARFARVAEEAPYAAVK